MAGSGTWRARACGREVSRCCWHPLVRRAADRLTLQPPQLHFSVATASFTGASRGSHLCAEAPEMRIGLSHAWGARANLNESHALPAVWLIGSNQRGWRRDLRADGSAAVARVSRG